MEPRTLRWWLSAESINLSLTLKVAIDEKEIEIIAINFTCHLHAMPAVIVSKILHFLT